jgi:hypothetical protein
MRVALSSVATGPIMHHIRLGPADVPTGRPQLADPGSAMLSGSAEPSLGQGHASSFRPLASCAQAKVGTQVHLGLGRGARLPSVLLDNLF